MASATKKRAIRRQILSPMGDVGLFCSKDADRPVRLRPQGFQPIVVATYYQPVRPDIRISRPAAPSRSMSPARSDRSLVLVSRYTALIFAVPPSDGGESDHGLQNARYAKRARGPHAE